jgi:3-hydroxymyristoyl/3-hydroxydecanoyl-(acyl carrier protein) dehydratase
MATGEPYVPTTATAADSILAQALTELDFPRVIKRAWDDGIRLFIEPGPGSSCTRMITKILAGSPFVARALSVDGWDDYSSTLRLLALLISERADVDLASLYHVSRTRDRVDDLPALSIPVGRATLATALPSLKPVKETAPMLHVRQPESVEATLVNSMIAAAQARTDAHEAYLRLSGRIAASMTEMAYEPGLEGGIELDMPAPATPITPVALNREQCMEFAVGSIAKVLGPAYAAADHNPTRVRLPDEPLMLVDRILEIDAEPHSMTSGRLVTEHDILEGAWYLDAGRIPTCIVVEAGQADLFLSAYLGIDAITRGLAVYRLLDAVVTFHDALPVPGTTVCYEIKIDHFMNRGDTWLFWFSFEATVNGQPLMSMREGCAGFFTRETLDAGKGIVKSRLDSHPIPGRLPADWQELVPQALDALDESRLEALRKGDLVKAFGDAFAGLELDRPLTIPGGKMRLVHRVEEIDPRGGRYGIGSIRAEADIDARDWFLVCHFVDDRVMPGTLMYECCLHTLRLYLLRLGWVGDTADVAWQPVPGVKSRLRCRGEVTETTRRVTYELSIKELGFNPEPFAIVDALMYADGKPVVEIADMSIRLSGSSLEKLTALWSSVETGSGPGAKTAIYTYDQILAFSQGYPSRCFGERFIEFDGGRPIACLPQAPFLFIDQITDVGGELLVLEKGMHCEAQVAIDPDAWYFTTNRQQQLPYSILLEIALQPCGWLAAYAGSSLLSDDELKFRNLGGLATMGPQVMREADLLTTSAELTEYSHSGGMIIQRFRFTVVSQNRGPVYDGTTYFGFFAPSALANQVGLVNLKFHTPDPAELARATAFALPREAPFPDDQMRMVQDIEIYVPDGGPQGLGFIRGTIPVTRSLWFFDAHFRGDPVWPGSLGLEAFLQLLKVAAVKRWGASETTQFYTPATNSRHEWTYRGQIVPSCETVAIDVCVTAVDDTNQRLTADGVLRVDGRTIYHMKDFVLEMGE